MEKFVAATSVIAVLVLVGFGAWYLVNSPTTYSRTPESITIGFTPFESVALLCVQPYANAAKDRLGANAIAWSAQSSQPLYTQVISTNQWITEHPELVTRLLKSLGEAEEYVNNHPAEANAVVQEQLNLDANYMDTVWQQNRFLLSLDQSLIKAMEDEARWMISNNLTTERQVPNFLDYIHEDELKAIKPESVNIIR